MARFIEPGHEILTPISEGGKVELSIIERAARTCYKSEDRIAEGSAEKLVRSCIRRGHESILEHSILTVRFVTDRAIANELVRHRIAAYSQESTRYCNYSKDKFGGVEFVLPSGVEEAEKARIECLCANAETEYGNLIRLGYRPEQARAALPLCTKTELVASMNYREWRHVFALRCSKAAHPDIRALLTPLRDELRERIPVVFDEIGER